MTGNDDWDDDRLTAAFHTRFDRSAPPTVARAVHAAIAGTTPTRFHAFERLQARHLATAAVVIVLVGALTVALADFGRLGGGPSTPAGSGGRFDSRRQRDADGAGHPRRWSFESLPIIQVTDAIAVRDAGVDDRELAVQGWFASMMASCPAPNVNPINPLQVGCPDGFVWLMERPESVATRSGNQTTFSAPSGPALNPDMDGIDRSWEPGDSGLDANGGSTPLDVVFVGHFDDRRAALCPQAEVEACRDRFVVDAVASVHGVPQPRSVMREVRQASAIQGSTGPTSRRSSPTKPRSRRSCRWSSRRRRGPPDDRAVTHRWPAGPHDTTRRLGRSGPRVGPGRHVHRRRRHRCDLRDDPGG